MDDRDIESIALSFAKKEKKRIAKERTDPKIYLPDEIPVSVFMAGSPGAGKTEFSKNIISSLEKDKDHRVIRIDGDEIRTDLPGYTGDNSYLFQSAISLIVERIHDLVLSQKQSFVFDGTFSKYEKALKNIQRSLNKGRQTVIFYVYQHPATAWEFTKKREQAEGRSIPKESFIDQFFGAMDTIKRIRNTFNEEVVIFLVKKDYEINTVENVVAIKQKGPSIDDFIKESYTKDQLQKML